MAVALMKCSPEECRSIAKKAYATHPLLTDEQELKQRALLFQALGNETRLKILAMLVVQELCVCDIVRAVGGAATTMAYHLKMLEDAGVITSRETSRFTFYTLNCELLERHRVFK